MPRIRTIKPEFPQSESMGRVSRDARLLFIQLWTLCDDAGRTRAASRMLASLLYPYDNDAPRLVDKWMAELEAENCVIRYQVDGQTYLQVCNWLNHQKIDRPSTSKIPPFDEPSRALANPREPSSLDQGKDQGKDQGSRAKRAAPLARPDDVSEEVWNAWVLHRKAKRATITEIVLADHRREAQKAGITLEAAFRIACSANWQGFVAEWYAKRNGSGKGIAAPADPGDKPWFASATATEAKGREMGLDPTQFRLEDGRPDWQGFKAAVMRKAGVQPQGVAA